MRNVNLSALIFNSIKKTIPSSTWHEVVFGFLYKQEWRFVWADSYKVALDLLDIPIYEQFQVLEKCSNEIRWFSSCPVTRYFYQYYVQVWIKLDSSIHFRITQLSVSILINSVT